MRLGELLALAWEDIDFEANLIKVQRSYSHVFTTIDHDIGRFTMSIIMHHEVAGLFK